MNAWKTPTPVETIPLSTVGTRMDPTPVPVQLDTPKAAYYAVASLPKFFPPFANKEASDKSVKEQNMSVISIDVNGISCCLT